MRTYLEYKDSGVEWIGEIPKGWESKSTKFHFLYKKGSQGQMLTSTFLGENPGNYPVYSGQTENKGILGTWSDYEFDYSNGVIFVTTVGAKCMTNRLVRGKFSLSQNCLILIPRDDQIDPSFINYFLHYDFLYRKELLPRILQPSLRMEDIDQYKILVPPLSEQKQISDYLDRKTQQIDDLIEKTERKIELLKEQRSSLINQCVTKGLDPNVEMEDSGVEWIGEIPKGWNLKKLTRVCTKIRNGYVGPTRDIMTEDGVKYIQGIHIKSGEIKYTPNGPYYVSPEWSDQHHETLLEEGDVLVVQTGTIGEVGYVTREFEHSNCHALIIVRINKNIGNGRFLLYSFLGGYIQNYLQSIKTGEILYHINTKKLRFLHVLIPPLPEQKQISDYLDKETSKIDQIVDTETKRIDLLKEYRQSLISNVVTGKIDVRDEVIQ